LNFFPQTVQSIFPCKLPNDNATTKKAFLGNDQCLENQICGSFELKFFFFFFNIKREAPVVMELSKRTLEEGLANLV